MSNAAAGAATTESSQERRGSLVGDLFAGIIVGVVAVYFATSFVSLIFAGELEQHLAAGVTLALVSQVILLSLTALLSSMPLAIGHVQDVPTVVFAAAAAGIAAQLGADAALPTILAALGITTLLVGVLLVVVGRLRLGRLARFVPYPVVGGFIAATGVLLVQGGFQVSTGLSLTLANWTALRGGDLLAHWLPALLFAVIFLAATRFVRWPLAVPAVLIGAVALFYVVIAAGGMSLAEARAAGWLFEPVAAAGWQPLSPALIAAADWPAIAGQAGNIAIAVGLTLTAMLLNVSAIEVGLRRQVDLNRELLASGAANALAGLAGGMPGYHAMGLTPLARRLGGRTSLAGVLAGLVSAAALLMGPAFLSLVPVPIVAGLLIYVGLDFLYEWVIEGALRFAFEEYAVVLLILVVIVATNFVIGAAVGLLAMIVMFVVSYSRARVVHSEYTVADVQSIVLRAPDRCRALAAYGDRAQVLELQGFLFFGTANTLLETVMQRLNDTARPPLEILVLDFTLVTGMDSSAALGFRRVGQVLQPGGVEIALAGISPTLLKRLALGGWAADGPDAEFRTLNQAIEWCEERLLARYLPPGGGAAATPAAHLVAAGLTEAQAQRLLAHLTPVKLVEGEYLIRVNDPPDSMYFITGGQVTAVRENADGSRRRLRTLTEGTTIGEMALILNAGRTASVVADTNVEALRLDAATLDAFQQSDPELLRAVYTMFSRQLVERLLQNERGLRALQG